MRKMVAWWIPLVLIITALSARLIPGPRTIDDAYITYRYARNILSGEGFVFNPGERVLGTTTGLYTLMMAAAGSISGGAQANFPVISWLLNASADAITCVVLWQIGKRSAYPVAGAIAGLTWAVAPYSVTFSIGGLETSLFILLQTAAILAYLTRRYPFAALFAGMSLILRLDGLILVGLIFLDWLIRAWRDQADRPTIRTLLLFSIPVAAWLIFTIFYFGNPLPHSIQAKIGAYRLEPTDGLVRLLQHYATPFLFHNWIGTLPAVAGGLVVFPFLFLVGARRAVNHNRRLFPWAIYPWAYFIVFAAANPLIFRWYLAPPLPAYLLFILIGLQDILFRLFKLADRTPPDRRRWTAAILIMIVLSVGGNLSDWKLNPGHGPNRPAPDMAYIELEILYRQAADIVQPLIGPDTVLAAGDVGVLGYYTSAKILDTVGLNSPQAIKYYPLEDKFYVINYAVAPELILHEKPDLIVILEVYGRHGLFKTPDFIRQYQVIDILPTDMYGSDGMYIMLKN